jgi:hypothetical protein
MVYDPAAVPAGMEKVALAAPDATVPEVTVAPTCVPPCDTVKDTVPELTAPAGLVTVADRVTFCAVELKFADAFAAVEVVEAWFTVNV